MHECYFENKSYKEKLEELILILKITVIITTIISCYQDE